MLTFITSLRFIVNLSNGKNVWLGARTTLKDRDSGDITTWTWSTIAMLVIVMVLISALMIWHYFAE